MKATFPSTVVARVRDTLEHDSTSEAYCQSNSMTVRLVGYEVSGRLFPF